MKRIAFGCETKMQVIASHCPGCGAAHGALHAYGCPLESCPECGGRLLECTCIALDVIDQMKLTKTIAQKLTREVVHQIKVDP
jgi:Zn-finger nucleic acid-binding protein